MMSLRANVFGFSRSGVHRAGWALCALVAAVCSLATVAHAESATPEVKLPDAVQEKVDFVRDIQPIFVQNCFSCHAGKNQKSNFRLDVRDLAQAGGDSGPVWEKGKSADSLLIQYVAGIYGDESRMPPKEAGRPLTPRQIGLLRAWIDQGAVWPDSAAQPPVHWAFAPLQNPPVPKVDAADQQWVRNPIDAFVLTRMKQKGLRPNAEASRVDLIRRLSFDLIGLPPTPEEVDAFVNDSAPDAYEKLVDRLLASPRYGETWGRHWLDLARYADSDGFEYDYDRDFSYRYRDYVIRSFNDDKPYDQFVVEQLAGDELAPNNPDAHIATMFLRSGPSVGNQETELIRLDELDDVVHTTGQVFLGLTIGCARCHDHKYDPVSQREYYQMVSIFDNMEKVNKNAISSVADSTNRLARRTYLLLRGDPNAKSDEVHPGVPAAIDRGPNKAKFPTAEQSAELSAKLRAGKPTPTDKHDIKVAERDAKEIAQAKKDPKFAAGRSTIGGSYGRRSALAKWIVQRDNPLTPRVMANRLWLYHFGRGLVDTPSNFGLNGSVPTHPELLDYLAGEFLRQNWRMKAMHRQIVTSATYRQSATRHEQMAKIDPLDEFYWRYPRHRITAEAVRDSILAVSGKLNLQMFGMGIKPRIDPTVIATGSTKKWDYVDREEPKHWRRSVYIFIKRSMLMPLMEGFDAPTSAQTCEQRINTTVATQAMQLMNNQFTNEQAEYMADRVISEVGQDTNKQIERAFRLAFARAPSVVERGLAADFIRERMAQVEAENNRMKAEAVEADRGVSATAPVVGAASVVLAVAAPSPETAKKPADVKAADKKSKQADKHQPPVLLNPHRTALADFCHVLINSNEFVYPN